MHDKIVGINKKDAHRARHFWGNYMQHYQRLRDMREDADKTQKDIAEILGTVRQQYARWENGEQELPMHHFITLARFYNVSLDYLAGLIPTPRPLN